MLQAIKILIFKSFVLMAASRKIRKAMPLPARSEIMILGGHLAGKEAAMPGKTTRCLVCGKPDAGENTICPRCQAMIRGEALERRREIRREAEKALHKEGTEVLRKKTPARAA